MTIQVTCGGCQKEIRVKDEHAGRTARCPQCGGSIKIPSADSSAAASAAKRPTRKRTSKSSESAASAVLDSTSDSRLGKSVVEQSNAGSGIQSKALAVTAASDPNQLMREILTGFEGDFPRVVPTIGYRCAALIVAAFMVLLPLVYVALVVLFGYALYWHATVNIAIFSQVRGSGAGKGAAFVYLAPLVIGGVLILFMVKPLFARPPKRQKEVEVAFTDEPILHSFVQRLCEAVNAPQPALIEVNCEVNAGAFYRNGWWGFLTNNLGLQIGLPLLALLDMRQLAGVLAHELGHFSQGGGMRLSYIIRSVNMWFYRVIYERDEWDEWLSSTHEEDSGWIVLIGMLTSLFVWLTRRILWVLMIIGHIACCALLRQMEYDADKYEARLAGSDVFESTTRRMRELGLADYITNSMIASCSERAGLPDNLPLCLSKVARDLPPDVEAVTDQMINEGTTGWLDSHPADRDRIAAARKQQAAGIFHIERPAKALLKDFTKIAEAATLLVYKRLIGSQAAKQQMTSTAAFLAQIKNDAAASAE